MSWAKSIRFYAPLLLLLAVPRCVLGQAAADEGNTSPLKIPELHLTPEVGSQLRAAMEAHDYVAAEKLLLAEINRDPHSPNQAALLAYIGSVYFENHDFLNAAVALKKAEAIGPLDPDLRFLEAMAYIRLQHSDWARKVLESLATQDPKRALYQYWLGRLDYDGHEYNGAIRHFQRAIELDPAMARAYDNIGLCYYYQNQNELALRSFEKAIDLERNATHPSPWPYLDIAITLQFLNRPAEAETNLREAIRLNPDFAKAHFQLGTVLEDQKKLEAALAELKKAAAIDSSYPEPHMAMARLYHKLGQEPAAREEVKVYRTLHARSAQ